VLQAERDSVLAIDAARNEAQALAARATEEAQRITRRCDSRMQRVHERCARILEQELQRLQAAGEPAQGATGTKPTPSVEVESAGTRLAAALTLDDP
jgi:hypothetical protein